MMKESVLQNGENEAVLRPQRIQLRIGLETAMNIGVASIYENFIFFSDRDGESLLVAPPHLVAQDVQHLYLFFLVIQV